MPRGRPAGNSFPSPVKVAKTLVEQERQADKDLIARFSPQLMTWEVGKEYKTLNGDTPAQEERLVQLLVAAGWSARIVKDGVEVDYPKQPDEKKKAKKTTKQTGMRKAGSDPSAT